MQTSLHTVVKNIFHKDSLRELSEQQIQEFVLQYPYSSLGHLLLAKKKKEESSEYRTEAAMAALYVNNPLWLHCLLSDEQVSIVESNPSHEQESFITPSAEGIEVISIAPVDEDLIVETEPIIIETESTIVVETGGPIVIQEEQELSASIVEFRSDEEIITENSPTDNSQSTTVINLAEEFVANREELSSPIVEITEKFPEEKEPIFEPYHTIDYFASQGIKLRTDDLGNDKLGRQLKSFTEWLRSMKRVAPVQVDDPPQEMVTDAEIQKNAEESIEISDVETEAMAEVWLKQGKSARAAAIYRKLSLLNPAKSHYFAAKIEQLND